MERRILKRSSWVPLSKISQGLSHTNSHPASHSPSVGSGRVKQLTSCGRALCKTRDLEGSGGSCNRHVWVLHVKSTLGTREKE